MIHKVIKGKLTPHSFDPRKSNHRSASLLLDQCVWGFDKRTEWSKNVFIPSISYRTVLINRTSPASGQLGPRLIFPIFHTLLAIPDKYMNQTGLIDLRAQKIKK